MVIVHAPGIDRQRVRQADDRNFLVLTLRNGRVVDILTEEEKRDGRTMMICVSRCAGRRLVLDI